LVVQRLQVYSTGYKFPPYKYDPDASPGTAVGLSWRRNGQPVTSRRVLSPTLVRPLLPPHPLVYISASKAPGSNPATPFPSTSSPNLLTLVIH
jgi:hypothetical protein